MVHFGICGMGPEDGTWDQDYVKDVTWHLTGWNKDLNGLVLGPKGCNLGSEGVEPGT